MYLRSHDVNFFCRLLQGLIDIAKEITKLEDKKAKLSAQLGKLQETTSQDDYVKKVPENVRQQNSERVRVLDSQLNLQF